MDANLRFGPDDEQEFGAARRDLLDAYEAFLRLTRPVADLFIADLMLMYRWQVGDGRILRWTREDLDGFLLDYLPRKATLSGEDIDAVPADAGDFLDWLAGRGMLSGDPLPRLHAAVKDLTPAFRRAAADPGRRGPAGQLVAAMQEDGVNPTDPRAVEAWMNAFNALPLAERDRILGWEDDAAAPDQGAGPGLGPMPAVELLTDAELATAAGESVVLTRLATVTRFLDPRRKLTQKGHLSMADGRALTKLLGIAFGVQYDEHVYPIRSTEEIAVLDRSFRWARAAGLVKVRHGWASATARGKAMGKRPHMDWLALVKAWMDGKVLDGEHAAWYHEPLIDLAEELPSIVYRTGRATVADLGDLAVRWFDLEFGSEALTRGGDDPRRWIRQGVARWALDPLVELGAISVSNDEVTLTPLGRWGVNRWLREQGLEAPVVGELAGADALTLLSGCADRSLDDSEAEIRRWIAARPETAAGELGEAAAGSADLRVLAFHALGLVGPAAEPVVRALVDMPPTRGLALLWLAQQGHMDPDTTPTELLQGMLLEVFIQELDVEGIAAVVAHLDELGPEPEQVRWVESLLRVDHPRATDLLQAIGRDHPRKPVAKAARTTAFKRLGLRLN